MKKFKRMIRPYKEYIFYACLLIGSILIGAFFVIPGIRKTLLLRKQIQTTAAEIEILRTKATLLGSLTEESLIEQLKELITALPGDVSTASIFSTIDGVIQETGANIGTYSLDSEGKSATKGTPQTKGKTDTSGSLSIPIDLVAKGTLDQIQQFIVLLPKVKRLFRVHQVSLSIHEDNVSSSITADSPYKKLPTAIGGPGSPLSPITQKEKAVLAQVERFPNFVSDFTKEFTPQLGSGPRDPFAQ